MSSGSSAARRLRAAVVAAVLVLSSGARASELRLWPLFHWASDGDDLRWSALGPLVEFHRTATECDLQLRPLLWLRQARGARRDDRADVLYPLAATRSSDDYRSVRVLLFSWRRQRLAPGRDEEPPHRTRFTLFPFVFYRETPTPHLSVLPLWLDQDDFLGYQHVRAVAFPAYLRLTEPRVERRFFPFPFVSTLGGPDGRGWRVWPFYGTKEIVGRERTRYVLWPFYVRSERLVPGYGWETRRLWVPAYATIDGAGRRSRGYGMGSYLHTIDDRRGIEAIGAPWPLVYRERPLGEERWNVWRVAPFYGRSEREHLTSHFYAWPAYRTKTQDVDGFHYQRRDVGLVLGRWQSLRSTDSGRDEALLTVFPALRAERQNGRRLGQVPALLDSLLPRNRGVLALWAPLYGLVRWDTRPDGSRDWSVLWGAVSRTHGRLRGPWYFTRDAEAAHGD